MKSTLRGINTTTRKREQDEGERTVTVQEPRSGKTTQFREGEPQNRKSKENGRERGFSSEVEKRKEGIKSERRSQSIRIIYDGGYP